MAVGSERRSIRVQTYFDQRLYGSFVVGVGFQLFFSSPTTLLKYLSFAAGAPAALDADLLNPTSTSSGIFGADVIALKLNVDFGDAGLLPDPSGVNFGNLRLCGLAVTGLNNMTVRQFEALGETMLGGGTTAFSIVDVDAVMESVDLSFSLGAATSFAQANLVNAPACP